MKILGNRFWLALILGFALTSQAADKGGNAGDPLMEEFEDARQYAAARIESAQDCAFNVGVPAEVRSWILANKPALVADVLGTHYNWVTDTQATCGWTQTTSMAPISFSFDVCRPQINDVSRAIWMIVHETVHHFGHADEDFPNEVASAITSLGLNSSCPSTPSSDPFDPASCPGVHLSSADMLSMVPLPTYNQKWLGKFAVWNRQRSCYSPNWCTQWQSTSPLHIMNGYQYYPYSQKSDGYAAAAMSGSVVVEMKDNKPQVNVLSDNFPAFYFGFEGNPVSGNFSWEMDFFPKEEALSNSDFIVHMDPWSQTQNPFDILSAFNTKIDESTFSGWMTRSCLRETYSGSFATTDSLNNNITIQYEGVILSQFDK